MVHAFSDREYILQRVVQMLLESADTSNDSNLVLQLALTELVKQTMRELAQDPEAEDIRGLLQKAVQATLQQIGEQVEMADLPSRLAPYFERIHRSLRPVASEMTELGLRLRSAREGEVVRFPRIVYDAPVPFRVTELGTRGNPEGLIVQPLGACRLNLERVRREYRVRGFNYPWEVQVGELTFVVEVDGSILTFLAGFPASVLEQARSALEQLAQDLYDPILVQ